MPETDDSENKQEEIQNPSMPPVDYSRKLAKEMMISLENTIAGLNKTLTNAESVILECDNYDALVRNEDPLAKAIVQVCKNHPDLNPIFPEAFCILKVDILRKVRENKINGAIHWFKRHMGS